MKVNLVKVEEEIIVAVVVSEANIVMGPKAWVLESGCTKHVCGNKNMFTTYNLIKEGTEKIYIGDSQPTPIVGKGKVVLKLTSGKILSLNDVLYVSSIRHNLVSVSLLGKDRIKIIFDDDLVTLSKNDVFMGKAYLDESLYV